MSFDLAVTVSSFSSLKPVANPETRSTLTQFVLHVLRKI